MSSFDIQNCEKFTAGAMGEPGARVFFLQARGDGILVTLKCEKEQVRVMGEYFDRLLESLDDVHLDHLPTDLDLEQPAIPEWAVGSIGVAFDTDLDQLVLVVHEVGFDEDDPDDDSDSARFVLSREQVNAFVNQARVLVESGRPPCRLCGRPLDANGHTCPMTNGHSKIS